MSSERVEWARHRLHAPESTQTFVEALLTRAEQSERALGCTICGGIPPTSGKPCVCKGTNKIHVQLQELLVLLAQAEQRVRALEGALVEIRDTQPNNDPIVWGIVMRANAALPPSVCEWCWAEAQRRVMFCGGSVTARYHEVLSEQEKAGKHALCPFMLRPDDEAAKDTP